MPQEHDNYAQKSDIQHIIPKASATLSSGDYVVMPRNVDPMSRAVLGAESRVSPIATAWASQWGVGVVDTDFSTGTVGATLFASPGANQAVPVIRRGVVRMSIIQTSGKAGDLVMYSSGATGAQLFTINNYRRDVAVGRIWKDFTGATANDHQAVELIEKPISERDIYFWLQNRVVFGLQPLTHTVTVSAVRRIRIGRTGDPGLFMVKGKLNSIAINRSFLLGSVTHLGKAVSILQFYWLAVKISTTGAAIAYTKETCTAAFTVSMWTASQVSAGMLVPKTWNSNMIPFGLAVMFSATRTIRGGSRLIPIQGPGLPFGTAVMDQTKWYL
jgi:hypothetical protein